MKLEDGTEWDGKNGHSITSHITRSRGLDSGLQRSHAYNNQYYLAQFTM